MALEIETCSRCGGSGEYSYCQMYGTKCFKCHGTGKVYTKRGLAAKMFFEASLTKTVLDLAVGEKILSDGGMVNSKPQWYTVQSLEKMDDGTITIHTDKCTFSHYAVSSTFRVAATAEKKAEAMIAAEAYQNTLTQQGKPRKFKMLATA
jgi:hypothetical protein